MKKLFSLMALAIVFSNNLFSQNILKNPGFENVSTTVPNPKAYCRTLATSPYAEFTPAQEWGTWVNNESQNSCLFSELVSYKNVSCLPAPPKNSQVGGNVMHLISTIGHAGIAQNPLPKNNGVRLTCWVYVLRGNMTIGVINTGNSDYQKSAISTTTCKWEKLSFEYAKPIDNVTIYSRWASTQPMIDGAEFYIDDIVIEKL
jgi:hypothetical protein